MVLINLLFSNYGDIWKSFLIITIGILNIIYT